jgi:hypothetical protein
VVIDTLHRIVLLNQSIQLKHSIPPVCSLVVIDESQLKQVSSQKLP